jgi:hypothetical protein
MIVVLMLGWWYGAGWKWVAGGISRQLGTIAETFSVKILIRTWLSPWKQIHTTGNIRNFFSVAADNAVSRMVGFTVRTFMLLTALIFSIFTLFFGGLLVVTWPLLPLLVLIMPIVGLLGIGF